MNRSNLKKSTVYNNLDLLFFLIKKISINLFRGKKDVISLLYSLGSLLGILRSPYFFMVDNSGTCSNNCVYCKLHPFINSDGDFDINLFKTAVTFYKKSLLFVVFGCLFEPFENDNIYELIRFCDDNGIIVMINTSGKNIKLRNFKQSIPELIHLSLSAWDRKSYRKIHGTDSFHDITHNIKKLKNYSGGKCLIHMKSVINRFNEDNISDLRETALNIRADKLSVKRHQSLRKDFNNRESRPVNSSFYDIKWLGDRFRDEKSRRASGGFYMGPDSLFSFNEVNYANKDILDNIETEFFSDIRQFETLRIKNIRKGKPYVFFKKK